MCEICRHSPCHPRCPNAPEPPVVCVCSQCGEGIYEGDEFYDIHGEEWCENCIEDCVRTAEVDEFDYDED